MESDHICPFAFKPQCLFFILTTWQPTEIEILTISLTIFDAKVFIPIKMELVTKILLSVGHVRMSFHIVLYVITNMPGCKIHWTSRSTIRIVRSEIYINKTIGSWSTGQTCCGDLYHMRLTAKQQDLIESTPREGVNRCSDNLVTIMRNLKTKS